MKKILIGIGIGLLVLLGAVLVAPSFIDWTSYKDQMRELVYAQTGRVLTVDGDIRLALLPKPSFSVSEVRLSNPEGTSDKDMLRLGKLEINLAVWPLLKGEFHVLSARLIDPEIYLERFSDGRSNLGLSPAEASDPSQAPASEASALDLRMDSFVIENGRLSYRDATAKTEQRAERINAEVALASLEGPFEASGSIDFRGHQMRFEAASERLINQQTLPFRLGIYLDQQQMRLGFVGAATDLQDRPTLRGKLTLRGDRLGALAGMPAGAGKLFDQDFEITAAVKTDQAGGGLTQLALRLGEVQATGSVEAGFAEVPEIKIDLNAPHVDLDKLIGGPIGGSEDEQQAATVSSKGAGVGISLPTGLSASLNLTLDALTYRDSLVRQGRMELLLNQGALRLKQLSAQFPGGSNAAISGVLRTPQEGPVFEGQLDLQASDLRQLMAWIGVSSDPVSANHLRVLRAGSKIRMTATEFQFPSIDVSLDGSQISGGLSIARRKRLAFGADFTIDRINLDAYLPNESTKSGSAGSGGAGIAIGRDFDFDGNLRLRVGEAVVRGLRVKQFLFDGTYAHGDLTLRQVTIGQLAGAQMTLKGAVTDLDGLPTLNEVSLNASTKDVALLASQTGINLPDTVMKMGAVSLSVKANGSALTPQIDVVSQLAGGQLQLTGKVNPINLAALFDGTFSVRHPDAKKLFERFQIADPSPQDVGPLALQTSLQGGIAEAKLTELELRLGESQLRGQLDLDLSGPRPRLSADLSAGRLVLDPFLGAKTAPKQGGKTPSPSSADRFSKEPLDLTALSVLDGAVTLRAEAIKYDAYELKDADLAVSLNEGVLEVSRLNGGLFEGVLSSRLRLAAKGLHEVSGKVLISDLQLAQALAAITGKSSAHGRLAFDFEGGSSGRSRHDLVSALSGQGSVKVDEIDVKSTAKGSALAPLLDLVLGLNAIGGGALQGKNKSDQATVSGRFAVDQGRAESDDLALVTALGSGAATGSVDLPKWRVDLTGSIRTAQTPLMALLAKEVGIPEEMGFEVTGPLDEPTVRLQSARPPESPAIAPTTTTPGAPPPPPEPSKKPTPEDLLRGLLRGLGG